MEVVEHDMRTWRPPQLADVLVSELLGSFGDNELSPECLDCANWLLKPGGISIPAKYTSYLAPVSSQKNWTQVVTVERKPECPFVVKMHNATVLGEPQVCFIFEHPSTSTDHKRFTKLLFPVTFPATIHGLIGYFDGHLYGDFHTSILPSNHTAEMSSWFPIFFPLKQPQMAAEGDVVEVCMWRSVTGSRVWYEWLVSLRHDGALKSCSGIHNPSGKSYWIGK